MTDDKRRERVKARVEASQKRMREGGGHRRAPERPQTLGSAIEQHPGLFVAGGLIAGVVLGSLLPKGTARKLVQRSSALAAVGAELAAVYSRHAFDKAEAASREGKERLGEFGGALGDRLETLGGRAAELGGTLGDGAARAGQRAARVAGDASSTARDAGRSLARKAFELAASARR